MQEVQQVYALLKQAKKIIITTHQKPDGDAMGAALGLYHFLHKLGHEVKVISPTNWASFLNWMPGCDLVLDYEAKKEEAEKLFVLLIFYFVSILTSCIAQNAWSKFLQK